MPGPANHLNLNPLHWERPAKIALLLAVAIGVIAGVIVGYLVYATGRGADGALSFSYWLDSSFRWGRGGFRRSGLWWGLTGGGVGAALIYIRRLTTR